MPFITQQDGGCLYFTINVCKL